MKPSVLDRLALHLRRSALTETGLTWLSLAVFLLLIPGLILPPVLFFIDKVVSEGEVRDAFTDVQRASILLADREETLRRVVLDWSAWDEMYSFALAYDAQFIADYFPDQALENLGMHHVVIYDPHGQVYYEKHYLPEGDPADATAWDAAAVAAQYPALLDHPDEMSERTGLIVVGGEVLLASSRPIITSAYEGPIVGTLLFAYPFDAAELEQLSVLGQRTLRLSPLTVERMAAVRAAADEKPTADSRIWFQNLDQGTSLSFQPLTDLNGQPAVLLEVVSPRALHQIGASAGSFSRFGTFAFCLALFVLTRPLLLSAFRTYKDHQDYLARFQAVVNQTGEAMLLLDGEGNILELNPAGRQLFRMPDTALPVPIRTLLELPPELVETGLDGLSQRDEVFDVSARLHDGTPLDLQITVSAISVHASRVFSIMVRDVSSLKAGQRALQASEERYTLSARGANDGLWDWDLQTNAIYFSDRWKEMLGYGADAIGDDPEEWFGRVHPDDLLSLKKHLNEHLEGKQPHFQHEHRLRLDDGTYHWMLARGLAVWGPESYAVRMAGSLTDIHRQKTLEEMLRYDALHDSLTGLANRTLIVDRLRHANERKRRREDLEFALLFFDLDHFKQINDRLGHAAGDAVLQEIAGRLQQGLRKTDAISRMSGTETFARIAGDEFVVLLEDVRSGEDALAVAERIRDQVCQPYLYEDKEIQLGASFGLVVPGAPYDNPEDMIRDADIAMYKAKEQGGSGVVIFRQEMYNQMVRDLQLAADLRKALDRAEFLVYYQPIHQMESDSLFGFEALIRWVHPTRGMVAPMEFITLAEKTGLIVPIGDFVLREACRQTMAWMSEYPELGNLVISVNLSIKQLLQPDLPRRVFEILAETGLPARHLWLEVTENMLIQNFELVKEQMEALRAGGIHIEIDDFGTGYSSLSYLQRLPVDGFKIDRSFIQSLDENSTKIVQGLVNLGHNLKLTLVAEGVETETQRDCLRSFNCDLFQGYLKARPMSADKMDQFLGQVQAGMRAGELLAMVEAPAPGD